MEDRGDAELHNATGTDVAFVGELSIGASLQLTNHIAVRTGYEVLWLANLALASNNAAAATADVNNLNKVEKGQLFYNGALAGVEFSW